MKVALSIAGSDSIAGAGIQADLKTFACFNVYGTTAITALTAQNTQGVLDVITLPPEFVGKQIEAVVSDSGVDAAKTGMLGEGRIVKVVARKIERYGIPLIVDPIVKAESGAPLLKEDAFEVLLEELIPLSKIVTPNIAEAERICGMEIKSVEDAEIAAKKIVRDFGCEAAVVKGGHLNAVDVLYFNGRIHKFGSERVEGCFHGTGCAFSAAITANIAKGVDVVSSVKIAKEFVNNAIRYALNVGKGCSCLDHLSPLAINAERWRMLVEFEKVLEDLKRLNPHNFIPEVGMNFAYALPKNYAKGREDVLAVEGRIVRGLRRIIVGTPKFGASDHLARALLTFMEFYPEVRCAANIRYEEELIEKARDLGFVVSNYDRREEPEEIKRKEGGTIPWGIKTALEKVGRRADIIYHTGDIGKEPMIVLFGENPKDLFEKISKLLKP